MKTTDSAPSTTTYAYAYATSADPRGLPTSRSDSVAGTFSAVYDSDGVLASEKLPGGYTLTVTRDEAGQETSRVYTRDSDNTVVASDTTGHTVQGQTAAETETNGQPRSRTYGYDAAGRLTQADEANPDGTCTRRSYTFDKNTNRTARSTSTSAVGSDCTSTGSVTTPYSYDSADRLIASGRVYDAFGRTTATPDGTTLAYFTNDLVRQMTTSTTKQTWSLDGLQRLTSWTTQTLSGGTWTTTKTGAHHYADNTDLPTWTTEGSASTITRNVEDLTGSLAATTNATGNAVLQLTDIHGDTIVQLPTDSTKSPTTHSYDEYGNPEDDTTATRYGWLGNLQRSSETPTGLLLMGVRLYSPADGRFLQTDPVPGGSQNAYDYAGQDPVNTSDPMGTNFKYKNDGWQCNTAGCVHLTRKCAEPSGYCSIFWAAKLTGHWRAAYSVDLYFTILVEGHTVSAWHHYGHPEQGSYYWHGSWGEHSGSDRGRYRYDLVLHGHLEAFSNVEVDFTGNVIMPGGKSYKLYGYGKW